LAWNLTSHEKKEEIKQKYKIETTMGLHLHCPEGSVNKEGPSAGTAITLAFYSLLNNKEISNLIAITGEISLDGSINEIGGLILKIMGAIKAGVKTILFPKENEKDYEKFILNHNNKELLKDITFYPVSNIKEVLDIVFI
jgi:ATP-dependent Lon protease